MAFTQKITIVAAVVAGVDSLQMEANKKISTEDSAALTQGWDHMNQFIHNHSRRAQLNDNHIRDIRIADNEKPLTDSQLRAALTQGWEHMDQFNGNHSRRGAQQIESSAALTSGWEHMNQFKGNHSRRGPQQVEDENENPFAFPSTVPAVGDQSKQIVDSIPASEENDQKIKTLVEEVLEQNPMLEFDVEQKVLEFNLLDDNHQALVELLNYFKTHNAAKFTNLRQRIQQLM